MLPVDGQIAEDGDTDASRASRSPRSLPPDTLPRPSRRDAPRARAATHLGRGAAPHRPRAPSRRGCAAARGAVPSARRGAARRWPRSRRSSLRERDGDADASGRDVPVARTRRPIDRDIKRLRACPRRAADDHPLRQRRPGRAARRAARRTAARPSTAALAVGVLDGGFVIRRRRSRARVLTDHEIFRRERRIRRARRYASGVALETLTALKPGDYVVHLEHGVGIYRGIETIFVGAEHASRSRSSSTRAATGSTCRCTASIRSSAIAPRGDVDDDAPPPRLHKLGGKRWAQQRDRTRAAIQEMTVELLDLYARRKVATRPPHVPDTRVAAAARVVVPLRGHARPAEGDRRT